MNRPTLNARVLAAALVAGITFLAAKRELARRGIGNLKKNRRRTALEKLMASHK